RRDILIGREIDDASGRAEGNRRPVLAAPVRRAEFGKPASARLTRWIDIGPAGFRIDAAEYVLLHKRLAVHEIDSPVGSFQEPQVAVARDVDQSLDRAVV